MLVVEVDVVDAEPVERCVDRLPDVLRRAVDRTAPVLEPAVAELRRDDVVVAPPRDRLADQLLVRALAIDVGGVEEVDPELGARWIAAIDSCSSVGPYQADMPMQPRPSADTSRPWPSVRRSM
jgi:hypothetical protein